jgi:dedicator of cytokinesis protein 1
VKVKYVFILCKLFQTSNPSLKAIREKMLELIKLRSQMLSGNLPVDEMKDIKMKATSEIDTGNKLLGKVTVLV